MSNPSPKVLYLLAALLTTCWRISSAAEPDKVKTGMEGRAASGFSISVDNNNPTAGVPFKLVVYATSETGMIVEEHSGEKISFGGADRAPDGTPPEFAPRSGWKRGKIEYDVTLYAAGGSVTLTCAEGSVRGESEELRVKPGEPHALAVAQGVALSGPPGGDVGKESGGAPEVIIYDRWENPVDGVTVKFGNVTNGGYIDADAALPGLQTEKVSADGGRVRCDVWVLGSRYGVNTMDAEVQPGSVPKLTLRTSAPPLAGFIIETTTIRPRAGATFGVTVTAKDVYGYTMETYPGEGFSLGGGVIAPDGTEPLFEPKGIWQTGSKTYSVTFFRAAEQLRLRARDGEVVSESDAVKVYPGEPDEITIRGGDDLSGPAGMDAVHASGRGPEVVVFDRWMNPVEGVEVEFGNPTNGGSFDVRGDIDGVQSVKITDPEGRASCDMWVLGKKYGRNTLDAWIREGTVRKVTFKATSYWISRKNLGLIFNIDTNGDSFLDLESYQGGIGVKYFAWDKVAYRGLFNFDHASSDQSTSLTFGNSLEYHFLNGRISPYVGGVLDIGYLKARGEIDSANWTESVVIPVAIGAVLGLEVVLIDYISLFVEYQLALEISRSKTTTSVSGVVDESTRNDFSVSTGLGNDAMIGVVVYLNRVSRKWRKESPRSAKTAAQ